MSDPKTERRRRRPGIALRTLAFLTVVAAGGGLGLVLGGGSPEPATRTFTVQARQYGYEPAVIRVNKGDKVRLRFASVDVVHGFYLEGHDLDVTIVPMRSTVELRRPSVPGAAQAVEEVTFTADREGKFRYRCSQTCGFMHPFMLGELIVGPNRLLPASMGLAVGVLAAGFMVTVMPGKRP